jgi:hypothetical protein
LSFLTHATKPGARRTARTTNGIDLAASLVLLRTSQVPNTVLMKELIPDSIVPEFGSRGMVYVKRTLQVVVPVPEADVEAGEVADKFSTLNVKEDAPLQVAAPAPAEEAATLEPEEAEDEAHLSVPHTHLFCIGDAAGRELVTHEDI